MAVLAVLQPSYLPWIGYFDQIDRADAFIFYDDVQYDKHGWRNRNRVKGPEGPIWLTVPVLHKGLNRPAISEVLTCGRQNWRRKHLGTMHQCYAKARYFDEYFPRFETWLAEPPAGLSELNTGLTKLCCDLLGISGKRFLLSSELDAEGERNERLVNLCKILGADTYLSGNAAQQYLDEGQFRNAGVGVVWQSYAHPVYTQRFGPFVPYLSVVDLLFNEGPNSLAVLRSTRGVSSSDSERAERDLFGQEA